MNTAARFFNFRIPEMIPVGKFDFSKLTSIQKKLISPYIPYFNYKIKFSTGNSRLLLGECPAKWPVITEEYFRTMFNFCLDSGFIAKRTH